MSPDATLAEVFAAEAGEPAPAVRPAKRTKAVMHFSKPGARQTPARPWTVHWRGVCHQVAAIRCEVPMVSEWKPAKRSNPRAFFTAQVADLTIDADGVAVLR